MRHPIVTFSTSSVETWQSSIQSMYGHRPRRMKSSKPRRCTVKKAFLDVSRHVTVYIFPGTSVQPKIFRRSKAKRNMQQLHIKCVWTIVEKHCPSPLDFPERTMTRQSRATIHSCNPCIRQLVVRKKSLTCMSVEVVYELTKDCGSWSIKAITVGGCYNVLCLTPQPILIDDSGLEHWNHVGRMWNAFLED